LRENELEKRRKPAYNDRRLGAAAAFTARSAGYFRSCSHCRFCGTNAAISQNRPLGVRHFSGNIST